MTVSAITLPAARHLGGGADAWAIVTACFAAVACIALWIAALAAGENDAPDDAHQAIGPLPGFEQRIKSLGANRPLLLVLGIALMNSYASTFFSKNLLYYFKYVRNDGDFGGTALALMAVVAACCAPFWAYMARLHSKRSALLAGTGFYALGLVLWYLFNASSYAVLLGILALVAVGASASVVCFWAMVPDTVEYGQWRSGVRCESLIIGTVIFSQKAALGIAAGSLGIALSAIGFVPNTALGPETAHWLLIAMSGVPLLATIGVFLFAWRYPINPALHRQLLNSLNSVAPSSHGATRTA
jgi:GPH family glycoside/pentoside/hexuronide:cation symporter